MVSIAIILNYLIMSAPPTIPPPPDEPIDLLPHQTPAGLTYDPSNGNVFVANAGDHTISVIDPRTHKIIDNISLSNGSESVVYPGPIGLVFDSDKGNYLYAANAPHGHVSIINAKTLEVEDTIAIGGSLTRITMSPLTQELYVIEQDANIIHVISTKDRKVIDSIQTGNVPWSVAHNPDDGNVYAAVTGEASVQVINATTHEITHTIRLPEGGPNFIAIDTQNHHVYVTSTAGKVFVIDTFTREIDSKIDLPDLPYGGYYDESNRFIAYDNYTDVIHSNRSLIGSNPSDIAFNPDNGYMYVIHFGVGVLNVIDTKSMTLIDHIPTRPSGYGIVYNPLNKTIYLSNESLNSVYPIYVGSQ